MTKVIVLAGGNSDEREVSLRSGTAVTSALKAAGYDVTVLDQHKDITAELGALEPSTVVFPVLHGKGGEDGTLQAQLEQYGVRFVGSGSQASALCFDKWQFNQFFADTDIKLPETELVDSTHFAQSALTEQPFVLKPYDGGSSIDTFIVRDPAHVKMAAIEEAFTRHEQMLLQQLIDGQEITVGILGAEALPVIEIIPPSGAEFDYDNKYNGSTLELCPPQTIAEDVQQTAQQLALDIHSRTGCRDFSRTDFIVTNTNEVFVLETNTIPGMTNQSLLPKAAYEAGLAMPEVVDLLVKATLSR